MANSADVASLKQSRSNVIAVIAAKTAEWVELGCPPTMSIDGESYQWNEWLKSRNDEIKGLTETINMLSSPWIVRSRGRA